MSRSCWLSLCLSLLLASLLLATLTAQARTYLLGPDTELIGEMVTTRAEPGQTLMDVARDFSLGHREIRLANPEADIWLAEKTPQLIIPGRFLLPAAPRDGIVINRSEMRLYYFDREPGSNQTRVTTFPVGIGRSDRQTPVGSGKVVVKVENPSWYPTAEVRADHAARGHQLPAQVPPGPDNPLGKYAIKLDLPGYVIHGTNRPDGIGMLVSQGCIRLYPEHIEALVWQVAKDTPVTIVDQPVKLGVQEGVLWLEVHPAVYGAHPGGEQALINRILDLLQERGDEVTGKVDWDRVAEIYGRADGIPAPVTTPDLDRLPLQRAER